MVLGGPGSSIPPQPAFSTHLPAIPRDSTAESTSFMLEQEVGCQGGAAVVVVTDRPLRVCDGSGAAFSPFYREAALAVFAEAMT